MQEQQMPEPRYCDERVIRIFDRENDIYYEISTDREIPEIIEITYREPGTSSYTGPSLVLETSVVPYLIQALLHITNKNEN
jgi:hypothetical protein